MTTPSVDFTQLDGALGIVPPGTADVAVVIAPATGGPFNTPAAFANKEDVQTNYLGGVAVELAAYLLKTPNRAVIVIRSDVTTEGAYGDVNADDVDGTCVPAADVTSHPIDEYEPRFLIVNGGTVGVDGITYQWSLDNGRSYSAVTALGTANSIMIPDSGVKFTLGAGTLLAGDTWWCRTTPPKESSAQLQAALDALKATSLEWDFFVLGNVIDAAGIAIADTFLAAIWELGLHKSAFVSVRGKNIGETENQYRDALSIIRDAASSIFVSVCADYARTMSGVNSRQYRRPTAWVAAQRACSSKIVDSARTSIAEVKLGPLPSDVQIRDVNGNPVEHDEWLNRTLDDMGYLTLRTFPKRKGVYITKDRVFAPTGSDFTRRTYRCCINHAADGLLPYLEERLESPIVCDAKTGYISKIEANDIEEGGKSALQTAIGEGPSCSGFTFTVSRTDNVLSTSRLRTKCRIVPLFYPDNIGVEIGFVNPARGIAA